jgi:hypothetical protein
MSQAFAWKYKQEIKKLGYGYRISSAGANVLTNQMVQGVTLDIGDRRFWVNLIAMPSLVLDVILGMNWMMNWEVVIDTRKRLFPLKIPRAKVLSKCYCLGK